jgi:hypothetical protein
MNAIVGLIRGSDAGGRRGMETFLTGFMIADYKYAFPENANPNLNEKRRKAGGREELRGVCKRDRGF